MLSISHFSGSPEKTRTLRLGFRWLSMHGILAPTILHARARSYYRFWRGCRFRYFVAFCTHARGATPHLWSRSSEDVGLHSARTREELHGKRQNCRNPSKLHSARTRVPTPDPLKRIWNALTLCKENGPSLTVLELSDSDSTLAKGFHSLWKRNAPHPHGPRREQKKLSPAARSVWYLRKLRWGEPRQHRSFFLARASPLFQRPKL